jgi:UDP-N-acetylmuramoyl-L-alanyl-D-glutamate--2,6-diaminopimelate ligase
MVSGYVQTGAVPLIKLVPESVDATLAAITVEGIELDSRKIKEGDLFLACKGRQFHGRQFVSQALERGAKAVLVESDLQEEQSYFESGVPVIPVSSLSSRSSQIAGEFYGHPSAEIELFGVTGTNGKTSCSQIVAQLCRCISGPCGVVGTLGSSLDGRVRETENTTPDGVTIQALLAGWLQKGVRHVAMEVSSHALDQGRVSGLQFDTAILTNLSRDHLDYHGDMGSYGEAKARLFSQEGLKRAVVNLDDNFGRSLLTTLGKKIDVLTFSLENPEADIFAEQVEFSARCTSASVCTPWGELNFQSPLLGEYNLSNILACIAALGASGVKLELVEKHIPDLAAVSGRMEVLSDTGDIQVVVDYAHTPDALKEVLVSLRKHCEKKLWCLFGCGGDRDSGKRSQMGFMASTLADEVMLTSDNPRTEIPRQIIEQVLDGCEHDVLVEEDRARAIEIVLSNAGEGDVVLIAGKGHEQYQQIGGQRIAFSDVKQVKDFFVRMYSGTQL